MTKIKRAIVIGASSGIGRALAKILGDEGIEVGLASRRLELLHQLQKEIPAQTYIKRIDVSRSEEAMRQLKDLIDEMRSVDLVVVNAGINSHNINVSWKGEIDIIDVNVSGFSAMINVALKYFQQKGSGHIVGISSIAALRGSATCLAYSASKAYESNYLEGLRYRLSGSNIYVTDVRPGLVDTDMIRGQARLFWVATCEKAARQIYVAIKKKRGVVYITKRWNLIALVLKILPDWLYRWRYRNEF